MIDALLSPIPPEAGGTQPPARQPVISDISRKNFIPIDFEIQAEKELLSRNENSHWPGWGFYWA
jgi:hypothetical protein